MSNNNSRADHAPAQAAEPVAIPDESTFQRLFIKHGGPVDSEGWCINESGLRDFLHELAAAPQRPAQADARDEDAYVAKRLSEALAEVYTTLIGDDKVDADEKLNAIKRVERAAQVLRLEVELYRAQAEAQKATRVCTCPSGDGSLRWPCRTHSSQQVPSAAGALTDEQIDAIWNNTDTRCCASLAEARRYFARALLTTHIQGSRK